MGNLLPEGHNQHESQTDSLNANNAAIDSSSRSAVISDKLVEKVESIVSHLIEDSISQIANNSQKSTPNKTMDSVADISDATLSGDSGIVVDNVSSIDLLPSERTFADYVSADNRSSLPFDPSLYFSALSCDLRANISGDDDEQDCEGLNTSDSLNECDITLRSLDLNDITTQRVSPLNISSPPKARRESPISLSSSRTSPSSISSCVSDWKYSANRYNDEMKSDSNRYSGELDEWEKKNSLSRESSKSSLNRVSLYRQFDPLVSDTYDHKKMPAVNASPRKSPNNEKVREFEWMNIDEEVDNYRPRSAANNGHYVREPKPDVLAFALDSNCEDDKDLKELIKLNEEKLKEKDANIEELKNKLSICEAKNSAMEKLILTLHNVNTDLMLTASQFIEQKINENNDLIEKCNALSNEKIKAIEEVNSIENSFSDLHRRYEKIRSECSAFKESEGELKGKYSQAISKINELNKYCRELKDNIDQQNKNSAENMKKSIESEMIAMKAQLRRAEMKIKSLENHVDQKSKENAELTAMVDELIVSVRK